MADSNVPYLKLVTSEHSTKPKYMAYVEAFLKLVSPTVDNYDEFDLLFNLENAVGDQLDKLGELVGIGRQLPTDDPRIPPLLSDNSYRLVIKAKIYKNHWDGTREGLETIFNAFFPNLPYEIVDNQDMSYTITIIDPTVSEEFLGLIMNGFILPKPSGVLVNYNIMDSALFGWDAETAFIQGWDRAAWSSR